MANKCRICGNLKGNKEYRIRDMMFKQGDFYIYYQCGKCGCLQISQIPQNMNSFYPESNHSFHPIPEYLFYKRLLIRIRDAYAISNCGLIGRLLYQRYSDPLLRPLAYISTNKKTRILDVGCGSGLILHTLRELGYVNLSGIDPYLPEDYTYPNGLRIMKKDLSMVEGEYDFIMFHHSFEHLINPLETLRLTYMLLSKDGICLIRIPVVSSYAWEYYREHWVQVDAPRHFFIHSIASMMKLASKANYLIKHFYYDSTDFQFWGSEQYRQGIPLNDPRSYLLNPVASIFTSDQISDFKGRAKELNLKRRDDRAVFYLSKLSAS